MSSRYLFVLKRGTGRGMFTSNYYVTLPELSEEIVDEVIDLFAQKKDISPETVLVMNIIKLEDVQDGGSNKSTDGGEISGAGA